MRLVKFAIFCVIIAVSLPYRALAASFTDDMAVAQNAYETQYSGLTPYSGPTYGLSDQTLLTVSDGSPPQGHALYRVNAAETITVGIYTLYGTCVAQKETGFLLGQGARQALWSRSMDAIYSDFGGSFWRFELNQYQEPVFAPASALPGDAAGFGLNIYALPGSGKPLPAAVTKSASEALCYEEYTASIPVGTQYVKVEINSISTYPVTGGGTVPNRNHTSLASVRISGAALVMGEPAKTVQQQIAQAPARDGGEESVEPDRYSAAVAADSPPAAPQAGDDSDESSKKASSSKFEGTITSSSKQEKSQASKTVKQSESQTQESTNAASEASSQDEVPRAAVYEIRRENGGGLNFGVTVYIIAACGALALALIFGRKR